MAIKNLFWTSNHAVFGSNRNLEIFVGELSCSPYSLREYYFYSCRCLLAGFYNAITVESKLNLIIDQLKGQVFESYRVLEQRIFKLLREDVINDPQPVKSLYQISFTPLSAVNEMEELFLLLSDFDEFVTTYISTGKINRKNRIATKRKLDELVGNLYHCNRMKTAAILIQIIRYCENNYRIDRSLSIMIPYLFKRAKIEIHGWLMNVGIIKVK